MLFSRRNRARNRQQICCHDECDYRMAPRGRASFRRQIKRSERHAWKKDAEKD